jgi:hypothetical protein
MLDAAMSGAQTKAGILPARIVKQQKETGP